MHSLLINRPKLILVTEFAQGPVIQFFPPFILADVGLLTLLLLKISNSPFPNGQDGSNTYIIH
jgi:hypothetical protein